MSKPKRRLMGPPKPPTARERFNAWRRGAPKGVPVSVDGMAEAQRATIRRQVRGGMSRKAVRELHGVSKGQLRRILDAP